MCGWGGRVMTNSNKMYGGEITGGYYFDKSQNHKINNVKKNVYDLRHKLKNKKSRAGCY